MNFEFNRPKGFIGKGDKWLPEMITDLTHYLGKLQKTQRKIEFLLPSGKLDYLATALVEFAEDIHNDLGIWRGLEAYNIKYFKTPIPFVFPQHKDMESNTFNAFRIHHFLWVLYSELNPDLVISPTHKELFRLSELVSIFLTKVFKNTPKDSGIKKFLMQPDRFVWDIKKKLLWLGQHSYMFQIICVNNLKKRDSQNTISVIDDFVCEECTPWSGLGVIDILSELLDINKEQHKDLRSWYERHYAYYEVLFSDNYMIKVKNLISDDVYTVGIPPEVPPFKLHIVVLGSLVPWDGIWYWSGVQYTIGKVSKTQIQELKTMFLRKASNFAYRYCNDLAQKARSSIENQYEEFVKYHGDNLAIYPDGLSMAADQQQLYKQQYASVPKKTMSKLMKEHNLKNPWPKVSYPPELLEDETGIGVFFDSREGQEIMQGFSDIINGMKKRGVNLTEDESETIRGFIYSDAISPQFIMKMVGKYGDESIAEAFLMREAKQSYYLEYLLRKYKGHFYKNRYPNLAFC
ncbi:MAG: DUF3843 family protein [Candidatus Hatepunaea meridiana]|nr:DUF3843 family protein [Candidatus Hatepunaea meridiana]